MDLQTNKNPGKIAQQATRASLLVLIATGLMQAVAVWLTGSLGLLADTLHNLSDAATAGILWLAFWFSNMKAKDHFTYGYGRLEDFGGLIVAVLILGGGIATLTFSGKALFVGAQEARFLIAVSVAALIGLIGNLWTARIYHKAAHDLKSHALNAGANHAHSDALGSVAVLIGAAGTYLGYPFLDPVAGAVISLLIIHLAWHTGKPIIVRLLDGVEPETIAMVKHAVSHVDNVSEIGEIRARWSGHRLYAELTVAVEESQSLKQAHDVAKQISRELERHLPNLATSTIHLDPHTQSGSQHHR